MKTIVLEQPENLKLSETQAPSSPGPGLARVRVRRVGICGTDLHAYRGRQPFFSYPRILGHELGVEILELGDDADGVVRAAELSVGDICAVEPYLNCGLCGACRAGKTNCCTQLQVLGVHIDGGMSEEIIVPTAKLHRANDVPIDHLALVEMLCIGAHAVARAELKPGEPTLVIGAGPIGLGVMLFAGLQGAHVLGMEMNRVRVEFAASQLGISDRIDPVRDPDAQLRAAVPQGPTTVFDATGNVHSMQQAFHYPAHGGKLVFVGLVQDDITFSDPYFHSHELTLLSSRNATARDFRYVIDALTMGSVKLDPWITHRTTPDEIVEQFPAWLQPSSQVVKAMLEF